MRYSHSLYLFFLLQPGEYVRIYIARVRKEVFNTFITGNRTPIVVGLLEFEHKMSVMNVLLKHSNNTEQPIKSKERLIFQCGFRRFAASPIFSQHTNGTKHKVIFLSYIFVIRFYNI